MAARLRMAMVPAGSGLIDNTTGGPPGFFIGNVHVLAGIPNVMRAMLASLETDDGAFGRLAAGIGDDGAGTAGAGFQPARRTILHWTAPVIDLSLIHI